MNLEEQIAEARRINKELRKAKRQCAIAYETLSQAFEDYRQKKAVLQLARDKFSNK